MTFFRMAAAALAVLLAVPAAARADQCSDAQALVDKAIAHYKAVGKEKAFADFMNKEDKGWVNGELYVIVATADGKFKVHAVNPKLIDWDGIYTLKDVNGVVIVEEMKKAAAAGPNGEWAKYTWTHPETKKLAAKQTWVKPHDGQMFMVGCYP